ncbi:benzoate 4-monooxygenase cytochrome [Apiospora kogelbergensis]|uniref:benzoate 4-monooxygenase cytochrome n=1 Tax=Apiospora kogelbergensis TaxID=1337665 RepID=UPI0031320581
MGPFSTYQACIALTGLAFGLLAYLLSAVSGPLSKVPGPWYSKFTEAAGKYHLLKGRKPIYINQLHDEYGPIVRIGPNEVSIKDAAAMQRMYSIKGEFPKAWIYQILVLGVESVFSTISIPLHRRYRRLLSSAMSDSGLARHKQVIDGKVRLAIQRMGKRQNVVDVLFWSMCMTTDIIAELSFGQSFNQLETGERNQEMLQHHYRVVEEEGEDSKPTLLSKLYRPKLGEEGLEFQEIRANAQSYIVAGSDTTSNTLTYLIWLVCKHNDVRVQLMEELDTLADSYEDSDLKKLPYLNHIIDETLRMYSSVPAGLPREVTAHCSYFPSFFRANVLLTNVCQVPPEGIEFCGHWIPGGTTVSAQAYSMHRDEVVFPNPLRFDPSRWERPTQAMKDSFVPFGGGSRICMGVHLAKMELRLAAARFFLTFRNARISTADGFCDEDMEPSLYFLMTPNKKRCLIEVD